MLGLPEQNSTHWVASTTHLGGHTVLEARHPKSRCRQSWFLLRAVRTGSVLGLSLLCGWLFSPGVSSHHLASCLSVSVSQYCVRVLFSQEVSRLPSSTETRLDLICFPLLQGAWPIAGSSCYLFRTTSIHSPASGPRGVRGALQVQGPP